MFIRMLSIGVLSLASAVALANDAASDPNYDKSSDADKDRSGQGMKSTEAKGSGHDHAPGAHPARKDVQRATFAGMDTDGDGSVSRQEFDNYFRKAEMFHWLDTNANGMIDEEEYEESHWDVDFEALAGDDNQIRAKDFHGKVFSKLDENGDQRLDEEEWEEARGTGVFDRDDKDTYAAAAAGGMSRSGMEKRRMNQQAMNNDDVSHDGMNRSAIQEPTLALLDTDGDNKISRQEFDNYFSHSTAFNHLDTNANGMIEEEEYEESEWDVDFEELAGDDEHPIGEKDFYDKLFSELDENDNQRLDEDEWDEARDTGFFDM